MRSRAATFRYILIQVGYLAKLSRQRVRITERTERTSAGPFLRIQTSYHHIKFPNSASLRTPGGSLKLKCRVVPLGNRDKAKGAVRTDSSTAPVAVIRIVLFVAATLQLRLASIEIKHKYLQAGNFPQDVYLTLGLPSPSPAQSHL